LYCGEIEAYLFLIQNQRILFLFYKKRRAEALLENFDGRY